MKLSPELHNRLCEVLLDCEEFESNKQLQDFIANGELAVYHQRFIENEFDTKEERVEYTIRYLFGQSLQGERKRPALPHFLMELHSTLIEGNILREELKEIRNEVVRELASPSPPHEIHPNYQMNGSSLPSSVPMAEKDDNFLDRANLNEVIKIVSTIIDNMPTAGRKILLRDCLPNKTIGMMNIGTPSWSAAATMIDALEARDRLHPENHCLHKFLRYIVDEGYCEEPVVRTIEDLLVRYNQTRRQIAIQREKETIEKQLQAVRGQYRTTPTQMSRKYKIDTSSIIQYNLHEQRNAFINALGSDYHGLFVFTVANSEQNVLQEYVLKSLVWRLNQHIGRPTYPAVRTVNISLEHLDFSSVEQGVRSLQHVFGIQLDFSLSKFLSHNLDTDLIIVMSHKNIINATVDRFTPIALEFTMRLKAEVTAMLRKQGRYVILFWANHGAPAIKPLAMPTVLPTFERFEVDHLSKWIEHKVGIQLRAQHVSEQEIKDCLERLVAKVKLYDGCLPETYDILREALEFGGAF